MLNESNMARAHGSAAIGKNWMSHSQQVGRGNRKLCDNARVKGLIHTSREISRTANWSLSPRSFERLLKWLDDGADTAGEGYLRMRERLVAFFDRKGFANSNDLADETLNRVARRIEEEGSIQTEAPAKYCYVVARFVFLESLRSGTAKEVSLDEFARNGREPASRADSENEAIDRESKLECLDHCVGSLEADQRDLIFGYYYGQKRVKIENRRRLAEEAGISINALSIRAFRIRERLERCLNECVASKERN